MPYYQLSISIISLILFTIIGFDVQGTYHVNAEGLDSEDRPNNIDESSCDANGVCHEYDQQTQQTQHQPQYKDSKTCHSSTTPNQQLLSSIEHFYHRGLSAQAYKPNAPIKSAVCNTDSGDGPHNVAHWSFWRSKYGTVVPMSIHGNIYSCGTTSSSLSSLSSSDAIMEVWQPRPDGTYSSLRSGIEEGDCRASVPITKANNSDFSNILGQVQYGTLAPGSPGILGGLVPESSREYPPYGPGAIHMYLNIEGYHPLLGQLDINELEDWMLKKDTQGRFRFKGWRKGTVIDGSGGIEIQSVKKVSRPGYDLALEVEVGIFLVPVSDNNAVENAMEKKSIARDVFCSSYGYLSWISSFFKEPIAVCFPSLLDFFAL